MNRPPKPIHLLVSGRYVEGDASGRQLFDSLYMAGGNCAVQGNTPESVGDVGGGTVL